MPRFTVVIDRLPGDEDRYLPSSWAIDVNTGEPRSVLRAAKRMCEQEHVKLVKVIANINGKEVKV